MVREDWRLRRQQNVHDANGRSTEVNTISGGVDEDDGSSRASPSCAVSQRSPRQRYSIADAVVVAVAGASANRLRSVCCGGWEVC